MKDLEDRAIDKDSQCNKLREERDSYLKRFEEVNARLQKIEFEDEVNKCKAHIKELERDLAETTRRAVLYDSAHAEAESLRHELMEYVKFVKRTLPEELKEERKEVISSNE